MAGYLLNSSHLDRTGKSATFWQDTAPSCSLGYLITAQNSFHLAGSRSQHLIIENFSNDDGDWKGLRLVKMNLYFTFEFRNCLSGLRTRSSEICNATVQLIFQLKIQKLGRRCLRSPKYVDLVLERTAKKCAKICMLRTYTAIVLLVIPFV